MSSTCIDLTLINKLKIVKTELKHKKIPDPSIVTVLISYCTLANAQFVTHFFPCRFGGQKSKMRRTELKLLCWQSWFPAECPQEICSLLFQLLGTAALLAAGDLARVLCSHSHIYFCREMYLCLPLRYQWLYIVPTWQIKNYLQILTLIHLQSPFSHMR